MAKKRALDKASCDMPSEDLNDSALAEFRRLVAAEKSLNKNWKDVARKLTDEGIPDDLASLQRLVDGGTDAETEDLAG
jgi:hypothetical protein